MVKPVTYALPYITRIFEATDHDIVYPAKHIFSIITNKKRKSISNLEIFFLVPAPLSPRVGSSEFLTKWPNLNPEKKYTHIYRFFLSHNHTQSLYLTHNANYTTIYTLHSRILSFYISINESE